MIYTGTDPYANLITTTVYDAGGDNNGRLDPGETVDLTATLKNIGGVDFTNVSTTIESSDPYITITDGAGYFGALAIDSTKENTGDPYVVSASPSAPEAHAASFNLIATADGGYVDTFAFELVIGRFDYLVWNPDPTPVSGQRIDSVLSSLGYTGNYSTALAYSEIDIYKAIFVCVGIYSNNYIIWDLGPEASAFVDYLNNGGSMYLEGGDVWYYDPQGAGYNFCSLFGINALSDGSDDMGPVVGEDLTFTEGMNFTYDGENSFMDHINATGSGFVIFHDGNNNYNCGVANDAGSYMTVGTSFELGGLVDAADVSTKEVLLDSIMHFFDIFPTGVEEITKSDVITSKLSLYPNPFSGKIDIRYQITGNSQKISLKIFDIAGRLVRQFDDKTIRQSNHITWDAKDNSGRRVSSGVYFVHLEGENHRDGAKVILIE